MDLIKHCRLAYLNILQKLKAYLNILQKLKALWSWISLEMDVF